MFLYKIIVISFAASSLLTFLGCMAVMHYKGKPPFWFNVALFMTVSILLLLFTALGIEIRYFPIQY